MAQFTTEVDQLAKELSWLRQEFDGIKGVVNGWTGGAGTDPYFTYLRARDGFFDKPIIESARFRRIGSNQEFANGVQAGINFDEETWNTGLFSWSSIINSSRIYLRTPASGQNQGILITGYAAWTTISTAGQRYIQIDQYRSDDTLIGGERVATIFPIIEGESNQPFNLLMRANSSFAYITVSGFQSGGSTMSLTRCYLGLTRIF